MKYIIAIPLTLFFAGCSLVTGIASSCVENKSDGSRICTMNDANQNVTTRTIERDHKLFVSTCSYGSCSEFKEVAPAALPPNAAMH